MLTRFLYLLASFFAPISRVLSWKGNFAKITKSGAWKGAAIIKNCFLISGQPFIVSSRVSFAFALLLFAVSGNINYNNFRNISRTIYFRKILCRWDDEKVFLAKFSHFCRRLKNHAAWKILSRFMRTIFVKIECLRKVIFSGYLPALLSPQCPFFKYKIRVDA